MATIIKIPTWATFNKFPVGTPPEGLAVLSAVFGATFNVGDSNPVWNDLQDLDLGGGPLTRASTLTGLAEVTPIGNVSFLTSGQIQLAEAVGGEVIDCPLWFKVAEASYGDDVPNVLPNSLKMVAVLDEFDEPVLDELGEPTYNEVAKTWEEWNAVSHSGPWGGYYYIPTSAGNRYLLPASIVVASQQEFITQTTYQEVAALNIVEPE